MNVSVGLKVPRGVQLAGLWLTNRVNRQRLGGARVQACVFAVAHHPEPSVLLVKSRYEDWMPPQEGVMLSEDIEDAAWRCLEEEVGFRVEPAERRTTATFRARGFLGRLKLPEERHGERPLADDLPASSPLSAMRMRAKAYWAAVLVFASQYDLAAVPNEREVTEAQWCTLEEARERIDATVRPAKAALLHKGLDLAEASLPGAPMQIDWRPRDFIVDGRYCDAQALVSELENLRRARESKALVLFAFRGATAFRPLLRLVHEDQHSLGELRETLVRETNIRSFTRGAGRQDDPIRSLLDSLPLEELRLEALEPQVFERIEPARHAGLTPRLPASIIVLAFGGRPSKRDAGAIDTLHLMVNASAPVIAHRELGAQTELRQDLSQAEQSWSVQRARALASLSPGQLFGDPLAEEDSDWHPDDYATMLLDLALRVTRSSVGNLYVVKRDGSTLKRVAHHRNAERFEELHPVSEDEPWSVVMRVYERERPLIINDVLDYQRMNPQARYLSVLEDDLEPYAELAVPIEQGPFSTLVPPSGPQPPRAKPIGVINVERVLPDDAEAGDFTPRDLAALQTIAFLYSLRRSGSLTMASAHSLARLTQRNALGPASDALLLHGGEPVAEVPSDLLAARGALELIVSQIHALTRSASVTVRAVSLDQQRLVRLVASPPDRLADEHHSIEISSRLSVNAWVARSGMPCYIPNAQDRSGIHVDGLDGIVEVSGRKQIASELCLPIAVQGRILGTLNLESAQFSDYPDDVTAVVAAFAEQAGVAIAQARRADELRLFNIHAEQTRRSHLLYKRVGEFNSWLEGQDLDPKQASAGIELADEISEAAGPIRAADGAATVGVGASAARDAIEDSMQRSQIAGHVDVTQLPSADLMMPGLAAHVLTIALTELLSNAADYVSSNTRFPFEVRLRAYERLRGAQRYLCVDVTNRVHSQLAEEIVAELFRRPVEKTDRSHLGAYVAGTYVRSVGGELYARENGPDYFTATIELPLQRETPAWRNDEGSEAAEDARPTGITGR